MFDRIISLLAPHRCLMCGTEGALLCGTCFPDAVDPVPSRCYRCAAQTKDSTVCSKCRRVTAIKHVWVTSQYDGPPKELVRRLKFGRTKSAASLITHYIEDTVPALPKRTIVTFIPTATSRIRQRGYDQSELIAKQFAKQRGLVCSTLLIRYGQSRQVGSNRSHRIAQATKNYGYAGAKLPKNTTVLLIDDILTTGATLEAAAKILKENGVKTVVAAVFAQKQ